MKNLFSKISRKNVFPIILIVLGILCIVYDAILILINPGTFWDNFFSFTHIWSLFGLILIFVSIYKIKKGKWIWKRQKNKLLTNVSLSIFVCIISVAIINLILILTPKTCRLDEPADYVILLGGGIDKDGNLPSSVITRVEKAAEYLTLHPETVCVVTGGTLKWLPYPEAPAIKNHLIKNGIEPDRILLEDKAKDTIQNLEFSCRLISETFEIPLQEVLESKVVIVTSRFHLRRAERLAKRIGYKNIKGLGSKCPAVYILHNYFREICAYVKLNARIIFSGKPENILIQ
ncbi:MAG: YdcF family protein [Treponema sp.]|nr:YdcF family protein [Treponema sp.]